MDYQPTKVLQDAQQAYLQRERENKNFMADFLRSDHDAQVRLKQNNQVMQKDMERQQEQARIQLALQSLEIEKAERRRVRDNLKRDRDQELNQRKEVFESNKRQREQIKKYEVDLAHQYITGEHKQMDNRAYGYNMVNNDMQVKKKTIKEDSVDRIQSYQNRSPTKAINESDYEQIVRSKILRPLNPQPMVDPRRSQSNGRYSDYQTPKYYPTNLPKSQSVSNLGSDPNNMQADQVYSDFQPTQLGPKTLEASPIRSSADMIMQKPSQQQLYKDVAMRNPTQGGSQMNYDSIPNYPMNAQKGRASNIQVDLVGRKPGMAGVVNNAMWNPQVPQRFQHSQLYHGSLQGGMSGLQSNAQGDYFNAERNRRGKVHNVEKKMFSLGQPASKSRLGLNHQGVLGSLSQQGRDASINYQGVQSMIINDPQRLRSMLN